MYLSLPDNFASFANDVEFGQMVKHEGENVGQDGKKIHQVQRLNKELQFFGGTHEPDNVFNREVHRREGINPNDCVIQNAPVRTLLARGRCRFCGRRGRGRGRR